MKILVINGPNLNLLGLREPEIYGHTDYASLCKDLVSYGEAKGICIVTLQSNHEGDLVEYIQSAYGNADGIVINPGAYTHTSVAILDAVKAVCVPTVEVHISDPDLREEFRRVSYIRAACIATIKGRGIRGYFDAIDYLCDYLRENES